MPDPIPTLPKEHPATWEMVLRGQFAQDRRVRLHVIALRKGIAKSFAFEQGGVTYHVLKYFRGTRAPSRYWADTFLVSRLLRRIGPDLVHAWGNERGAGLVASRLRWRYLVTIQGLFTWYREALPSFAGTGLSAHAEEVSLRRARHATTESRFSVAYLKKRYPNLAVHQAEHAPNPLFASVKRQPQLKPIRIVTNGTIGERKGTDLFLKALAALPEDFPFEAVIIGAGNSDFIAQLRPALPPQIWPRIRFARDLSPTEVAAELEKATIFVLPTRADTSPNAVKEAVVAGVPVVASEVGGVPDYVVHGENGLLFPPGDLPGLIRGLRAACGHPEFSAGRVNAQTHARMLGYLSPERMAENFFAAYCAAIA